VRKWLFPKQLRLACTWQLLMRRERVPLDREGVTWVSAFVVAAPHREPSLANLKAGSYQGLTVEGICKGRTEDIYRDIQGFEFHVRVENCKLIKAIGLLKR
jgi:hypothetical protein